MDDDDAHEGTLVAASHLALTPPAEYEMPPRSATYEPHMSQALRHIHNITLRGVSSHTPYAASFMFIASRDAAE